MSESELVEDEQAGPCLGADCGHCRRLRAALFEAVAVLEETRKAFKSKQLEGLRKEFLRILKEEM